MCTELTTHRTDYITSDISTWENHSTNVEFLKRWWNEKIRFYVQLEKSVRGAEVVEESETVLELLTKNLKTFQKILDNFELFDRVLREDVWEHYLKGGLPEDLPLDKAEQYHKDHFERQQRRTQNAFWNSSKKQKTKEK